jgi:hypothetical protein
MYCLSDPANARSAGDFAAQDARQNTAFGARPFWLLLGQCQKVTRSAAGRVEPHFDNKQRAKTLDSGLRRNDE